MKSGETGDVRREMTSVPYGFSCRYDNGKLTGTVYAETLLEMSSSTVYRLASHRLHADLSPLPAEKPSPGRDPLL